jgi:hypothetical protein
MSKGIVVSPGLMNMSLEIPILGGAVTRGLLHIGQLFKAYISTEDRQASTLSNGYFILDTSSGVLPISGSTVLVEVLFPVKVLTTVRLNFDGLDS